MISTLSSPCFHPGFCFLSHLYNISPSSDSLSVKVCHPATSVIALVQGVYRERRLMG